MSNKNTPKNQPVKPQVPKAPQTPKSTPAQPHREINERGTQRLNQPPVPPKKD